MKDRHANAADATTSDAQASGRPLVTIGVPVYNGGAVFAEALESALAQDYDPLEIIIVDNASADETRSIAERFVARDRRVRYLRNATNVGGVENARRVLTRARGRYFTWLFHDDLICDPRYVVTVVEFLDLNPDVAACITAFKVVNRELALSTVEDTLDDLAPDRPWPEVRRGFFRWPQTLAFGRAVFSMFRRDIAVQATIRPIVFRGEPIIYQWEMAFLADVSARGRIVALPVYMRAYRPSRTTAGQRLALEYSLFDLIDLGLRTKLQLIRRALEIPLPFSERLPLLKTTLANLFRGNVRQPLNVRWTAHQRARVLDELRAAIHERSHLVEMLRGEIEKRRAILRAAGREPIPIEATSSEHAGAYPAGSEHEGAPSLRVRNRRFRLLAEARGFVRPASADEVEAFFQVTVDLDRARVHAEELLHEIQRLHREAASLLEMINALAAPPA